MKYVLRDSCAVLVKYSLPPWLQSVTSMLDSRFNFATVVQRRIQVFQHYVLAVRRLAKALIIARIIMSKTSW